MYLDIEPAQLEQMFVNTSTINRATGWANNVVGTKMQLHGFKSFLLAGKPAWYRCDLDAVLAKLEAEKTATGAAAT